MSIKSWYKRVLSKFTDKPIDNGISISCDNEVRLNELPDMEAQAKPQFSHSAIYNLRANAGRFELVGTVRDKRTGNTFYQLQHILTKETINVTKNAFNLLFNKSKANKGKDS